MNIIRIYREEVFRYKDLRLCWFSLDMTILYIRISNNYVDSLLLETILLK